MKIQRYMHEFGSTPRTLARVAAKNYRNGGLGLCADGEPIGASGLRQIHELVLQLRGTAKPSAHRVRSAGR